MAQNVLLHIVNAHHRVVWILQILLEELLCAKGSGKKGPQALPSHCCQVVISVQYNFHGAAQLRTEGLTRFKIRGSFAQDIHKTSPRECSHHTRGQSILPKTVK